MNGNLLLVLLRTVIGLGLIAAGVAIEILQYQPGLTTSVQIGNSIVGPILSFLGMIVTFWPAVKWFVRGVEKERALWREPTKRDKPAPAANESSTDI